MPELTRPAEAAELELPGLGTGMDTAMNPGMDPVLDPVLATGVAPRDDQRRAALREWVRRGGHLVVSAGAHADLFTALPELKEMLPARLPADGKRFVDLIAMNLPNTPRALLQPPLDGKLAIVLNAGLAASAVFLWFGMAARYVMTAFRFRAGQFPSSRCCRRSASPRSATPGGR